MGIQSTYRIVGLHIDQDVVCKNCCTGDEWQSFSEDNIIGENDVENDEELYFCDRCKERL